MINNKKYLIKKHTYKPDVHSFVRLLDLGTE